MGSTEILVLALILVWFGSGAVVTLWMRRSGYDLELWLALSLLLGPFSFVFAAERIRHLPRRHAIDIADRADGAFDVLAGIDPSGESVRAVTQALELFGGNVTNLTLVSVLDYDSSGPFSGIGAQSKAYDRLVAVATEIGFQAVELEILYGRPSTELAVFARDAGIELIVVGARGEGMSRALLGSVSSELIGTSEVPVFVGPARPLHLDPQATDTDSSASDDGFNRNLGPSAPDGGADSADDPRRRRSFR